MFDARLGRFYTLDRLSLHFCSWTPYNYALNCPILFTDDGNGPKPGEKTGYFALLSLGLRGDVYVGLSILASTNTSFFDIERLALNNKGNYRAALGAVGEGVLAQRIFNSTALTGKDMTAVNEQIVTVTPDPLLWVVWKMSINFQSEVTKGSKSTFDFSVTGTFRKYEDADDTYEIRYFDLEMGDYANFELNNKQRTSFKAVYEVKTWGGKNWGQ
jgi:hypothetical protein